MKKIFFIVLIVVIIGIIGVNCQSNECCTENYNIKKVSETKITGVSDEIPDINIEPKYTEEEFNLLAKIIWCEAGSDWLTDEHQRAVASVVINRKNDARFPNSIKEVIYQKGQYGCVYNGMINHTPNQRAYDNAKYVLENGVTIPENVVWQAQFKQGNGLYKYIQGHYFCY